MLKIMDMRKKEKEKKGEKQGRGGASLV